MSSILFYSTRKSRILRKKFPKLHTQNNGPSGAPGPARASPWRAEMGTLPKLSTIWSQLKGFCRKTSKNWWEKVLFSEKNLTVPKKLKGGTNWDFPTSILTQNSKKQLKGGPFGENFSEKKSRSAEKNWKGDPLVSPGMVCYAEKQEKPFWLSSLGQMVQFGAIIFCRTFKNYFGQFVWIESHYNSRVSLHEAPTKTANLINSVIFLDLFW